MNPLIDTINSLFSIGITDPIQKGVRRSTASRLDMLNVKLAPCSAPDIRFIATSDYTVLLYGPDVNSEDIDKLMLSRPHYETLMAACRLRAGYIESIYSPNAGMKLNEVRPLATIDELRMQVGLLMRSFNFINRMIEKIIY